MLGNKLSDIKTISSAKKALKNKNSSFDLLIEVHYPSSNSVLSELQHFQSNFESHRKLKCPNQETSHYGVHIMDFHYGFHNFNLRAKNHTRGITGTLNWKDYGQ